MNGIVARICDDGEALTHLLRQALEPAVIRLAVRSVGKDELRAALISYLTSVIRTTCWTVCDVKSPGPESVSENTPIYAYRVFPGGDCGECRVVVYGLDR